MMKCWRDMDWRWLSILVVATWCGVLAGNVCLGQIKLADDRPKCEHGILVMPLDRSRGDIAEAVRRLDAADVGIADIAVRRPTLDDVFISLTGHAAEELEEDEQQEAAA